MFIVKPFVCFQIFIIIYFVTAFGQSDEKAQPIPHKYITIRDITEEDIVEVPDSLLKTLVQRSDVKNSEYDTTGDLEQRNDVKNSQYHATGYLDQRSDVKNTKYDETGDVEQRSDVKNSQYDRTSGFEQRRNVKYSQHDKTDESRSSRKTSEIAKHELESSIQKMNQQREGSFPKNFNTRNHHDFGNIGTSDITKLGLQSFGQKMNQPREDSFTKRNNVQLRHEGIYSKSDLASKDRTALKTGKGTALPSGKRTAILTRKDTELPNRKELQRKDLPSWLKSMLPLGWTKSENNSKSNSTDGFSSSNGSDIILHLVGDFSQSASSRSKKELLARNADEASSEDDGRNVVFVLSGMAIATVIILLIFGGIFFVLSVYNTNEATAGENSANPPKTLPNEAENFTYPKKKGICSRFRSVLRNCFRRCCSCCRRCISKSNKNVRKIKSGIKISTSKSKTSSKHRTSKEALLERLTTDESSDEFSPIVAQKNENNTDKRSGLGISKSKENAAIPQTNTNITDKRSGLGISNSKENATILQTNENNNDKHSGVGILETKAKAVVDQMNEKAIAAVAQSNENKNKDKRSGIGISKSKENAAIPQTNGNKDKRSGIGITESKSIAAIGQINANNTDKPGEIRISESKSVPDLQKLKDEEKLKMYNNINLSPEDTETDTESMPSLPPVNTSSSSSEDESTMTEKSETPK